MLIFTWQIIDHRVSLRDKSKLPSAPYRHCATAQRREYLINWRITHLLVLGLMIVASSSCSNRHQQLSPSEPIFLVTAVIDGDTLVLENGEKVRLIGVDTPETKHPQKPVEYFGREATAFTKREIGGRKVRLEYDWQKRDKYGRLLAYVYRVPDHFFLNAEIIKQGYGHAYTRFPFKYLEEFRQHERKAREDGIGLWKE